MISQIRLITSQNSI